MSRYVKQTEDSDTPKEDESEEEYDENADEDFNPDKAAAEDDLSSSSEDEEQPRKPTKKSRKRKAETTSEDVDLGVDLASGDEETIQSRKSKKRRKDAKDDEESGGDGGFVRTRAQRIAEKEERKHRKRARDGEVTIDVDQIWAGLSNMPIGRAVMHAPRLEEEDAMDVDSEENKENAPVSTAEDMITIKKRIEYAGQIEEIEQTIPRSSKEAQRYLKEHPEADLSNRTHDVDVDVDVGGLHRPLKRPSMFEPNPIGLVKGVVPEKLRPRAPTRMDVLMAQKRAEAKKNAQKMSTVQKSQLDWEGYKDQEGLRDELNEYGKSKRGFLAREAFLDRAAGVREQAARDARLKLH